MDLYHHRCSRRRRHAIATHSSHVFRSLEFVCQCWGMRAAMCRHCGGKCPLKSASAATWPPRHQNESGSGNQSSGGHRFLALKKYYTKDCCCSCWRRKARRLDSSDEATCSHRASKNSNETEERLLPRFLLQPAVSNWRVRLEVTRDPL